MGGEIFEVIADLGFPCLDCREGWRSVSGLVG